MGIGRTEELLVGTALLHDLNETGLQLLNGGNVVGENTHLTGLGGDVNLDTVVRVVSLNRMVGLIGAMVLHTRWPGRWSVITN